MSPCGAIAIAEFIQIDMKFGTNDCVLNEINYKLFGVYCLNSACTGVC